MSRPNFKVRVKKQGLNWGLGQHKVLIKIKVKLQIYVSLDVKVNIQVEVKVKDMYKVQSQVNFQ